MVHPLPATKSDMAASINFLAITFCVHSIVAAGLWLLFRFEDSGIRQQVIGMLCYSLAFFWGSFLFLPALFKYMGSSRPHHCFDANT